MRFNLIENNKAGLSFEDLKPVMNKMSYSIVAIFNVGEEYFFFIKCNPKVLRATLPNNSVRGGTRLEKWTP